MSSSSQGKSSQGKSVARRLPQIPETKAAKSGAAKSGAAKSGAAKSGAAKSGAAKSGAPLPAPNPKSQFKPKKRKIRLPWQKPESNWFQSDHPTQRRSLKTSTWFPYAPEPEPEPEKPPIKVELKYRPWMSSVSSVLLVMAIGGAVTGCGWLSIQFLMNPKSVMWVNSYLPKPMQIKVEGWDQPYTIAEIQRQLTKAGLAMGDQIRLEDKKGASNIAIPVLGDNPDCAEGDGKCRKIVELRVYRPTTHPYKKGKDPYFQLVDQFAVAGMEDWFVQEPFVNAQVDVPPPSDYLLEFDQVQRLEENAPKGGSWLALTGDRPQLGTYGQIVYYDPKTATLSAMAPWSSPNGESPRWENIAAGGTPELVIDQTIGLETFYQVFSLQPDSKRKIGIKLMPIDLKRPALNDSEFAGALKLARTGLWSMALKQLDGFGKEALAENMLAQLQRDVVAYHAKTFREQAEQASASTSQQVQANLLDGRWEKAIAVVKAAPSDREAVVELLNADSGQLLRRISSALEVNPGNSALQAWNAAMKLSRTGKTDAIAWLKTQPANLDRNRFLSDLAPTLRPSPKASPSPTPAASPSPTPIASPSSSPVAEKIPDWWQPLPETPPPSPAPTPKPSAGGLSDVIKPDELIDPNAIAPN
jgi:hypothetical protein